MFTCKICSLSLIFTDVESSTEDEDYQRCHYNGLGLTILFMGKIASIKYKYIVIKLETTTQNNKRIVIHYYC